MLQEEVSDTVWFDVFYVGYVGFNCCQENKLPPPRAEIDCRQYPICRPYGCFLACRGWGYTGVGSHCESKKNPMKDECCCNKDPRHGATPLV